MAPPAAGRQMVLVLDNGGDTLRIGFAGEPEPRLRVPNCILKLPSQGGVLVGSEIAKVQEKLSAKVTFNRPFDRGYVTNWEVQDRVWKQVFKELHVDPSKTVLLVTEAPFAPPVVTAMAVEMIFEEYGFIGCIKVPAATLSAYHYRAQHSQQRQQHHRGGGGPPLLPDCVTVVDSGFSFTHIIPYYQGRALAQGVKRINVGGKLLTNLLKETVSFTKINMMDEFPLTNDAKEQLCFVSQDLQHDMRIIQQRGGELRRYFLLPDYVTRNKGQVLEPDSELLQNRGPEEAADKAGQTILMLDVERFSTPEVLFHPSDIGIKQAGVAEAIVQAVEDCDIGVRAALYGNVLLTGGNTKFPGFRDRVERELRELVPDHIQVQVTLADDPLDYAWKGGSMMGMDARLVDQIAFRKTARGGLQDAEAHFNSIW